MESVVSIGLPKWTRRRGFVATVISFCERVAVSLFACRHRRMSWPMTHGHKTYRTCVKCGMCRRFDPQTWKNLGPFYWNHDDRKTDGR